MLCSVFIGGIKRPLSNAHAQECIFKKLETDRFSLDKQLFVPFPKWLESF